MKALIGLVLLVLYDVFVLPGFFGGGCGSETVIVIIHTCRNLRYQRPHQGNSSSRQESTCALTADACSLFRFCQ